MAKATKRTPEEQAEDDRGAVLIRDMRRRLLRELEERREREAREQQSGRT